MHPLPTGLNLSHHIVDGEYLTGETLLLEVLQSTTRYDTIRYFNVRSKADKSA